MKKPESHMRPVCDNDLHVTFQSAYKVFHSTETSLLRVHNDIVLHVALDKGEKVLLILLDLSAAFDTVIHSLLLSRLQRYGLCGTVLKWFEPYLCNRTQVIKINELNLSKRVLSVDVPQGSVLRPVLYVSYHLYSDDSQLHVAFKTNDASSIKDWTESCVGEICCLMNRNDLKLNEHKTEVALISLKFRDSALLWIA